MLERPSASDRALLHCLRSTHTSLGRFGETSTLRSGDKGEVNGAAVVAVLTTDGSTDP
jgi:hypothetical protein